MALTAVPDKPKPTINDKLLHFKKTEPIDKRMHLAPQTTLSWYRQILRLLKTNRLMELSVDEMAFLQGSLTEPTEP